MGQVKPTPIGLGRIKYPWVGQILSSLTTTNEVKAKYSLIYLHTFSISFLLNAKPPQKKKKKNDFMIHNASKCNFQCTRMSYKRWEEFDLGHKTSQVRDSFPHANKSNLQLWVTKYYM